MPFQVVMPRLGQDMNEGVVLEWFKSVGDPVTEGEMLALIGTDKAEVEFESPAGGFVISIVIETGVSAGVGELIAWISADPADDVPVRIATTEAEFFGAQEAHPKPSSVVPAQREAGERRSRRASSPLARKRAVALGVDLDEVVGTGPGGRVTESDVLKASETGEPPATPSAAPPLAPMRAAIATHMTKATSVPQFQVMREVVLDRTEVIRKAADASYTDLILWATARALDQHPDVNARWIDSEPPTIEVLPEVNLGFAVAVEGGLIVPVIHDAVRLTLAETAIERQRLEAAVRSRRPGARDLEGATFTVSNLGSAGVDEFVAIVNTPEAGILAVGAVRERPVVTGGAVGVALTVRLTLTGDHRVFDGLTGARFMESITQILTGEDSNPTEEER